MYSKEVLMKLRGLASDSSQAAALTAVSAAPLPPMKNLENQLIHPLPASTPTAVFV